MSENSSLLFHWKKQKREFKMRSLIGLSWEKVGCLKSWIKLNLKSLLSGQFRFDFIASSQSPTSWKGLELTVALVLRFLLAAQTLSLELFRPEGEEVEPLYGPKILSQSEDFIFPRKKEETSFWRWYLCKSIFCPSTFKNGHHAAWWCDVWTSISLNPSKINSFCRSHRTNCPIEFIVFCGTRWTWKEDLFKLS